MFHCRYLLIPLITLVCSVASNRVARAQEAADLQAVEPATVQLVTEARDLFVAAVKQTGKQRLAGLSQSYEKLKQAAQRDSAIPPARTMWAKMLTSAGDQKAGRIALQQATIESPDDPEAFAILARFAVMAGQFAEAEALYLQANERLEPWPATQPRRSQLVAQIAAGRAAIAQSRSLLAKQSQLPDLARQFDLQAVDFLQQGVVAAPDNPTAHQSLASALFNVGQVDAAKMEFELAREQKPDLPQTEMWLAQSFVSIGDFDAAEAILEEVRTKNPEDVVAQTVTADLLMVMGEPETAKQYLERALELKPDDLAARRLAAQRLRFAGDWAAAAERLQELNNEFPTDFSTANLLALSLSESDSPEDRKRAVAVATVTAQRFSNQLKSAEGQRALVTLTWAGYASGQVDAAKKALSQLLSIGVQAHLLSGDEAYYLSRLLVEFGRPELAVSLLNRAVGGKAAFPKRADAEQLLEQLR